jgi:hypothetical protein
VAYCSISEVRLTGPFLPDLFDWGSVKEINYLTVV